MVSTSCFFSVRRLIYPLMPLMATIRMVREKISLGPSFRGIRGALRDCLAWKSPALIALGRTPDQAYLGRASRSVIATAPARDFDHAAMSLRMMALRIPTRWECRYLNSPGGGGPP